MQIIETERLILRTWVESDAEAYFHINQDPKVYEFLLGPLSMQQVQDFIQKCNQEFKAQRFCLFAVETKDTHTMIGFIGLSEPNFESSFTPCVEVGWRLGSEHWGKGYATEGAKAVLAYGFHQIGLNEIVSFTATVNMRSRRVMEKIGMKREPKEDFLHPKLAADHPISQHVLYRIQRKDFT